MDRPVVLDETSNRLLEELIPEFGGPTETIAEALRLLASDVRRREGLKVFAEAFDRAWSADGGPIDPAAVDYMMEQFEKLDESV